MRMTTEEAFVVPKDFSPGEGNLLLQTFRVLRALRVLNPPLSQCRNDASSM